MLEQQTRAVEHAFVERVASDHHESESDEGSENIAVSIANATQY